ncbi:MAG: ABC transporter ATP-binding protein, partial [Gammaproteobacteria bacterium]|nr:ABC transporter ATP-binding protein [Gammaproteobacteria bacterium]
MNSLYSHRQSFLTFPAMTIEIESLSHAYGSQTILREVSLTVAPGEVLCVLGPSGSGKSTLLRLIAGLEPIQAGRLRIGDSEITVSQSVPTEARRVGLVFQDHALFPHMTVAENIRFGLKGRSEERINTLLALVELTHFQDRYPHTLSGGQQQRVALIRALANDPIAMLLDEPFANVDVALRTALRDDALGALRKTGTATVLVTHDPVEAMQLGGQILVMDEGRILQQGTSKEVYENPNCTKVAQITNDPAMNL